MLMGRRGPRDGDGRSMICWLDARTWLTSAGDDLQGWTSYSRRANGRWRTAHALPYLRGIHAELGESTAECVAVHPELFSGLALIAAVTRKHFEDVALLKLTHRVVVSDTSGVPFRALLARTESPAERRFLLASKVGMGS